MEVTDELDAIYAGLPKIECKGLCHASCVSDISMSAAEMERIKNRVGYKPEAVYGTKCPMLSSFGMCSIYKSRPLICRLWGVVENLRCPFGCMADRILTDVEARIVVGKVGAISIKDRSKEVQYAVK